MRTCLWWPISALLWLCASPLLTVRAAVTNYVTNLQDSGPGSLRQAVAISTSGDVIRFRTNGTITLLTGELYVTNNIRIVGPGTTNLVISGNNSSRVFNISAGATSSISGLTIRDGRSTNGPNGYFYASSGGHGGGIYNAGNLIIQGCLFIGNATGNGGNGLDGPALGYGGGVGGQGGHGGGLYNTGTLVLVTCTFINNSTGSGGFGGNAAPASPPDGGNGYGGRGANGGSGGGVWIDGGTGTVSACTFSGNSCGNGGNGGNGSQHFAVTFSGSGGQGGDGGGMGIYSGCNLWSVSASTFSGNLTGNGGSDGSFPLYWNRGGGGGRGGGIFNGGRLFVSNCTISSNHCGNGGYGGLGGGGGGGGGGISTACELNVTACTIVGNACGNGGLMSNGTVADSGLGGGISVAYRGGSTPKIIQDTIVAQNSAGIGGAGPELAGTSEVGAFTSRGYNLIGAVDASSSGFSPINTNHDLVGVITVPIVPLLGPLQDNGGPILTHVLLAGSPAIDAGTNSGLALDARGQPRTVDNPAIPNAYGGDGTDIGAFEVNHILTGTEVRKAGTNMQVRFTTVSDKTYSVQYRPEASSGPWTTLPGIVTGTGGIATYTDTNAASLPRRFYRMFER